MTLILAYIIARWDTHKSVPTELFLGTVILDFFVVMFVGLSYVGA